MNRPTLKIAFFDPILWDYVIDTPRVKPLGGSQSALCYLAEALVMRGHEVTLINRTKTPGRSRGVNCFNIEQVPLSQYSRYDAVIILNAGVPQIAEEIRTAVGARTRIVLWTQHNPDQLAVKDLADPATHDAWDSFVLVSRWQADFYRRAFGADPARMKVIGNAIGPVFENLFAIPETIAAQKPWPPVLCYTSTPFRGLDVLLEAFPRIRKAFPGAILKVYSSMAVYGVPESKDRHAPLYALCRATEGVEYIGSVSQTVLADELKRATCLAYANTFAEGYCIAVHEAMAAGCIVISSDLGALRETTGGFAHLLALPSDKARHAELYAEFAIGVLERARSFPAQNAQWLKDQVGFVHQTETWAVRAQEWEQWLSSVMMERDAQLTANSELLRVALEHHQAGRVHEAEILYRTIRQTQPDHPDALHLLGMINHQAGHHANAIEYISRAIALYPKVAAFRNSLGEVFRAQGKLDEAAVQYRQALALNPDFAEPLNNLGVVLLGQGKREEAILQFRRALTCNPDLAVTRSNLGTLLNGQGKLDAELVELAGLIAANRNAEAEQRARQIVATWPQHGMGWKVLGALLAAQGRLEEATPALQRAVDLLPTDAETHCSLGNTRQGLGRLSESEASYRRAIELKCDYHEAYNNLGNALQGLGRFAEAEASYRRTIELKRGLYEAHQNLGSVLQALGRLSEAEASYRRAVELRPGFHTAHHNLGSVLQGSGRLSEAEMPYRRALELEPDSHGAHNDLGFTLQGLGRFSEAEASCRRAIELKPDYCEAYNNLGIALRLRGRHSDAVAIYRRALEIKPDFHLSHVNLGNALKDLGRLSEAEAGYRRALELKPDLHEAHSNLIFVLDLQEGRGIREQQEELQRWYEQHGRRHAGSTKPHDNLPDSERKLRIGYVSADFRRHAASYIFGPVICRHDRSAFEVICYSGVKLEDEVTTRLRRAAHGWRSTLGVSDDALAEQIRSDRIDILVDLSGHSAGNRLPVFARKPAPVQVTAWGYPTGTGLETMDYFLADPVAVPQEERSLYAEEVVDLPCMVCFEPPEYLPEVSPLPALGGNAFTFGCFNRIEKISDGALALWGRILVAVPEARFLIKGRALDDREHREQLVRRMRNAGIGPDRVRLMGGSSHAEHLKVFGEVDLGLDPFPYGGGISTGEALWMGVPVVTLNGSTIPGRTTASILTALQMQDWIARSGEEYLRIAVEAVRDPARLARTREQLRSRLAGSIFGDVQRYTRAVESAYRSMWRRWCAGSAAGPFDLAPGGEVKAVGADPGSGPSRGEQAVLAASFSANRNAEAEPLARKMVETWPLHGAGWKALGMVLTALGRLDEAIPVLHQALERLPGDAETHNTLGSALQGVGRLAESEASYRRAIELEPDYHEACNNLGNTVRALGRISEAEENYRRAIELEPGLYAAHHNLGSLMQGLGRLSEAQASYARAAELQPSLYTAHYNLGTVLHGLGRLPEAEMAYRRALGCKSDFHEAHFDLGRALHALGRISEGEAAFRRAVELKPDLFEAHYNRGNALKALGRLAEAVASYRRAVELNPGFHEAHSNLIFTLDMLEDCTIAQQQQERRRWYEQHGRRHAASIGRHDNLPDPGRRLRVGYVSADFHRHSASYIFSPVIRSHDRSPFEVFCYSGGALEDEVTAHTQQAVQMWRTTLGVSDEALAGQIRADRIDILIDLSGHSAGNRLTLFARKPAPVQVTAWGHAHGTGLETMDYFFADALCVPQEERSLYAEEVFDLPCIVCYEPPEYLPEVAPLPALGGKPFTFGCINRIEKISDAALLLWGRILAELPEARLLIKGGGFDDREFAQPFLRRLRGAGIGAERVRLLGTSPHAEHLKIYHEVDLGLDPFPHGGGTSTAEALWMGVPVVALSGSAIPGRVTAAILTALQMQDWIATSGEDYVRVAVEAARDLPRLARARAQLRTRLAGSVFGDVQRYTQAVESAYRTMWQRWCAGRTANPGAEAEARLRRAAGLDPGFHETHFNLACFLQGSGRNTEADVHYRRAIELKPDSHAGHNNLGNVLESIGRLSEAETNYRRAIALKPDLYQAHFNLGNALNSLGRIPEAEESLRCAIELAPDCHEAYDSLGTLLRSLGSAEAETCYRRALEIEPGYATAYNNLAVVLQTLGRASEAEACCRRTIELAPDFDGGYNNRARALRALGRLSAAEASYRRALELKPDSQEVHSNLLFLMAYCGLGTPEDYLAQARQLEIASIPQEARAAARTKSFIRRARGGRALRIGYVSGDLGSHVVSMNMQSVLEAHDHGRVEVFAYSTSGIRGAATDRIRQTVDHWHSLLGLSDEAAVELIAGHRIDVLVDLSGHTAHNRQGVFARRAAPVQCHYLGYFASTGNSQMDYWIGDSALIPPEHESQFVEQVWRVPRVWISYTPPERSPDPVWQPGADGRVCLGSFNEFNKLTERTVALWAKVLRRVPNAHLLLKTKLLGDAANRGSILAAFERHGIAADRIELLGLIADLAGHLSLYCRVDVALDPVGGITGGITTSEALWMGTPVITLAGARAGERLSAAILAGIGHAEWVARDEDAYVEKVAQLAANPALRRGLRHSLRSTMRESAFCDAAGMARALEDAFESMFDRWAAKTPAAAERR